MFLLFALSFPTDFCGLAGNEGVTTLGLDFHKVPTVQLIAPLFLTIEKLE